MITKDKFTEWLNKSKRNDKLTYYRGFLFAPHRQKLSPTVDERRPRGIRIQAYKAYDAGLVELVQKKHDDYDYDYIAVRK